MAKPVRELQYRTPRAGATVGLVGYGRQGHKIADVLVGMGYRLAGLCELDGRARQDFEKRFPGVPTGSSLEELASLGADVCIVATLAHQRPALLRALAGYGVRRILCEKPAANTMADVGEMRRLGADDGLLLRVNHARLWSPDYAAAGRAIREHPPGELRRVELRFQSKGFGNIGSHFLASLLDLTGRPVVAVEEAWFDRDAEFSRGWRHDDANGRAVYDLDGVELVLDNLPAVPAPRPRLSFFFSEGRVEILEGVGTWLRSDRALEEEHLLERPWGGIGAAESFAWYFDTVLGALLDGRRDRSVERGCDAVEAIIAAQLAALRGERVTLPLPADVETPFRFS
jgi:predicted dehydrogenase